MSIDFSKYENSQWLKGIDLEEGERLIVTISKVYEETFPSGEIKPVLEFVEIDKKLTLNQTRRIKLIELLGRYSDEWIGKQIALYPVDVNFNGKAVASVAVAAPTRKKAQIDDDPNRDVIFKGHS